MKIGIIHEYPNRMAGAEFFCFEVIRSLKELGHWVVLYSLEPVDWTRVDKLLGARVRPNEKAVISERLSALPGFTVYKKLLLAPEPRKLRRSVDLTLNTSGGSILLDSDLVYFQFYPMTLGLRERLRNDIVRSSMSSLSQKVYYAPYCELIPYLERRMGRVLVANSNFTARMVERALARPSRVLYPPVDWEAYSSLAKAKGETRQDVVLLVSRFAREKSLDLLPQIAAQLPQAHFEIISPGSTGEGNPYYEKFVKGVELRRVADRVSVSFSISDSEKTICFARAKVFLHLMQEEPFGISVAEALSAGLIPVVHDSGGPAEIVPKEWRYARYEEVAGLVEKALKMWSPDLAAELSSQGERFSKANFRNNLSNILSRAFENNGRK